MQSMLLPYRIFFADILISLLACSLLIHTGRADFLTVFSREGARILSEATVKNVTVRQCSCEEQDICVEELQVEAQKCADECWNEDAIKITSRPEDLRQCFLRQKPVADRFVACVKTNIQSCVPTKDGPQIPKQDIEKLITLAEERFESSKDKILSNPTVQPIRKVLDTAVEFGKCVKDCFMERSNHGACFEKHKCQPYIQVNRTRKTIRKCIRQVDWKSAAGELCKCSMDAGVSGLKNFCPMLGLIAQKTHIATS